MDRELIGKLFALGWLPTLEPDEATLTRALSKYQHFFGLDVTGSHTAETERSLETPMRFCALPDVMPLGLEIAKWPFKDIRWTLLNSWNIPLPTVKEAFEWAWRQWQGVCDIRPAYVPTAGQAHVLIECARIDGPSNTLAWSELANGSSGQKRQRYDDAEGWVFSAAPGQFKIDLGRVAAHEIGHVLGIPHITRGNLLQPLYDLNIRGPQSGDIVEAQSRYGPPVAVPPPPTGSDLVITLDAGASVRVVVPGYKLVKV